MSAAGGTVVAENASDNRVASPIGAARGQSPSVVRGCPRPLLEVKDFSVEFADSGTRAVEDVCLDVFPGEFVALVGESGCGKTMFASAIMNVLPQGARIAGGEILFTRRGAAGGECSVTENLAKLGERARRGISGKDIAMIFQDPAAALDPLSTCGRQIEETAMAHGMSKAEARECALAMMAKTGLGDVRRIYRSFPHELSGGQKQRVLIAASLVNSPHLLIADEPTSALDATVQKEILRMILTLNRETKTSLLLITHDFSVVREICERVYVMYAGRIVESGATGQVLRNPLHPYTAALLRSIPASAKKGERLFTVPGGVPSLAERRRDQCNFFTRCPRSRPQCARCSPPAWYSGGRFVECAAVEDGVPQGGQDSDKM